jgi:hypothetical protein
MAGAERRSGPAQRDGAETSKRPAAVAEAKKSKETDKMTQIKFALASVLALLCGLVGASGASAAFGLAPGSVDATVLDGEGNFYSQAGSHPFSVTTKFELNTIPNPQPGEENGLPISDGAALRNVKVEAPAGLVGDPTATPKCKLSEFMGAEGLASECPDETQVGRAWTAINLFGSHSEVATALYNLEPQPGQPALFAFKVVTSPVFAVPSIRSEGDYGIDFDVLNIDQTVPVTANRFMFWGVPASPAHDSERGELFFGRCGDGGSPPCEVEAPLKPFLTSPTDCAHGPFALRTEVQSWLGHADSDSFLTHDDDGNPSGVTRCDRVPFEPRMVSSLTTRNAESPSGLDFELKIPDSGIKNPDGIAQSMLKKAVVKLPEGVTANPSVAEGLGVCSPADYDRETLESTIGEGCPNSSRIGSVEIDSPLLDEGDAVEGSLYLGQPDDPTTSQSGAENPFDSLLSLYLVARVRDRGVIVKTAGRVEPDPSTGRLTATFDDLPQLPFSSFRLHFREGGRAPLVSPSSCGKQVTEATLSPYSAPSEPVHSEAVSLITSGTDGGSCPSGGVPPFAPGFDAGSINNNAKSFSPFYMRLTRRDGEQNMTKFSSILPPGVLGKLAGVGKCSEAAIAAAAAKTGKQELASPSCPSDSQIGRIQVGAGVGSVLTYVGGKVYLAGPYRGAPLSVAVVTPAVAGPFDVGTVVTREALNLNPETAEVEVDGSASDPIPHILKGIPLKLRDLRVYIDRDRFILNPTSCDPSSAKATLFGSFLDVFSPADDVPAALSTRYQASNCAPLGFKPTLKMSLRGGTARGDHPGLRAVLRTRPGDANIASATVLLPRSAFLDQAHIRTICTRVQFAADECPQGSVYGHAKAFTPLLDEPMRGPVYMRSSNHKLPDLVFALEGLVDVNVSSRIDSHDGGLRSTFEAVPDAPVSRFVVTLKGGKRGLVVNSRNLCSAMSRATVRMVGQNGKVRRLQPVLQARCGKGKS